MRLVSPLGRLSRGIAGIRGQAIICNTPGIAEGVRRAARRDARRPAARAAAARRSARRSTAQNRPSVGDGGSLASPTCCGSSCPRDRSRRRRSSCSRPPISTSSGRRRSTTRRRSTIRGSPRSASCARRRSPSTSRKGLFDVGITGRDWVEETVERCRQPRRAQVLEGDGQPGPRRRRGRRRLRHRARRGAAPGCPRVVGVPGADAALLRHRRASRPTSASRTAPARRRSPTSPTASSTSPRPGAPCGRPGCGSSTRSSPATPRRSPTRPVTPIPTSATRWGS